MYIYKRYDIHGYVDMRVHFFSFPLPTLCNCLKDWSLLAGRGGGYKTGGGGGQVKFSPYKNGGGFFFSHAEGGHNKF